MSRRTRRRREQGRQPVDPSRTTSPFVPKSWTDVSLGFENEKGEFQALARLTNIDETLDADYFRSAIMTTHTLLKSELPTKEIITIRHNPEGGTNVVT